MLVLVCYDIFHDRRRQQAAHVLEGYGLRVQASVFECHLDAQSYHRLRLEMTKIILTSQDMVRYYPLCGKDLADIRLRGQGVLPMDRPLILL